jgi:hypothetical protein
MDKVADEYDIKEAIVKYGAVATSYIHLQRFKISVQQKLLKKKKANIKIQQSIMW